jgi:acyl transferase domain-containing protein/NAD(P)-dependent dehydrogenase (short-subunit alcohol dehydrogenase family)/aryl carrier-like protein
MTNSIDDYAGASIAVIGAAGRFPGARNIDEYWRINRDGVSSISFFTEVELVASGFARAEQRAKAFVAAAGRLADIELFDAEFFGFSPREAELTDPQHRMFLECAWEALEDAGYVGERGMNVGVYAAAGTNRYLLSRLTQIVGTDSNVDSVQYLIGNEKDYLATRVSYKLDLRGPSLSVQTACSSSLVAVHLACESLLSGESSLALAGGVTVDVPQVSGYEYIEGGIRSPDGLCRAFDRDARGCVWGSGVGVVALKRLDRALADHDTIHAVIRGSAVNNDGAAKIGYSAPSVEGQASVILAAHGVASIDASTIGYVEAHGTGTDLGDPIEVAALSRAFRGDTRRSGCALGSAKTIHGHLDAAAGIAGFLRAALALKNRTLPPSLNFRSANPKIDFSAGPFYVNTVSKPWIAGASPRRAGVSSFGVGGTNAHVVLEEPPDLAPVPRLRTWEILPISGTCGAALSDNLAALASHLDQSSGANLSDIAFTLQEGRRHFAFRKAILATDVRNAAVDLRAVSERGGEGIGRSDVKLVFLLPGQGNLDLRSIAEIYAVEPTFREIFDGIVMLTREHGVELAPILQGSAQSMALLQRTDYQQPLQFAAEFAMAELLRRWGIRPNMILGHSLGELVGATIAGVFTLEAAIRLVVVRAKLMQEMPPGRMAAVYANPDVFAPLISSAMSIAAINGENLCTVSGPDSEIEALLSKLRERGVAGTLLKTSHAFHSPTMAPMLDAFEHAVGLARPTEPKVPIISGLTGSWLSPEAARAPSYWRAQMRQTIQFDKGITTVIADGADAFLDIGAGGPLAPMVKRSKQVRAGIPVLQCLVSQSTGKPPSWLAAIAQLWSHGVDVDWARWRGSETRARVRLPTYAFQRRRFWIENPAAADSASGSVVSRYHRASWEPAPPSPLGPLVGHFLIFADRGGFGAAFAARIKALGHVAILVRIGSCLQQIDAETFELDPSQPDHFDGLFDTLGPARMPTTIVHCWNLTSEGRTQEMALELSDRCIDEKTISIVYLTQAAARRTTGKLRFLVVSNRAISIDGSASVEPENAMAFALCRVISQEYVMINARGVDIQWPFNNAAVAERTLNEVFTECRRLDLEPVVALRVAERWVQRIVPFELSKSDLTEGLPRSASCVLITGGLGEVGLSIAKLLATRDIRLILLGRTTLPPRETWGGWLASDRAMTETARVIRAILDIEGLGAEVIVVIADIANQAEVEAALAPLRNENGYEIDGIIHAAGVPGLGLLQNKTKPEIIREIRAKVYGAIVLDHLFLNQDLAYFVIISSTISIEGGMGQAGYCAANGFLEAFVASRLGRASGRCLAIGFERWRDLGMGRPGREPALRAIEVKQEGAGGHPLLGAVLREAADFVTFACALSPKRIRFLAEHKIDDVMVVPATIYIEMLAAAAASGQQTTSFQADDLRFLNPLILPSDSGAVLRLDLIGSDHPTVVFRSGALNQQREHASGRISKLTDIPPELLDVGQLSPLLREAEENLKETVQRARPEQLICEQLFQLDERTQAAFLQLPNCSLHEIEEFLLHPVIVDRATSFAVPAGTRDTMFVPLGCRRLQMFGRLPSKVICIARRSDIGSSDQELLSIDLIVADIDGETKLRIDGYMLRRMTRDVRRVARPAVSTSSDRGLAPETALESIKSILLSDNSGVFWVAERPVRYVRTILPPRTDGVRVQKSSVDQHNDNGAIGGIAVEGIVMGIWRMRLGVENIGIDEDLFGLGGDSMTAVQIVSDAQRMGLELSVADVLQHPTIAKLASLLATRGAPEKQPVMPQSPRFSAHTLNPKDLAFLLEKFN